MFTLNLDLTQKVLLVRALSLLADQCARRERATAEENPEIAEMYAADAVKTDALRSVVRALSEVKNATK